MSAPQETIVLFDVDGTLATPMKQATPEMKAKLAELRKAGYTVGMVGGSDFAKQKGQLGDDILDQFDYVFSQNGLLSYHEGKEFHKQNLVHFLGNDKINAFVKYNLKLLSEMDIPVQRGTFIELRNGMFNISPIGRNCNQQERDEFEQYDHQHNIRKTMIAALQAKFPEYNLKYSIGGQISFDVFPEGWDKTYCLQFVKDSFKTIHFFGDKTFEGGNDFEIYNHPLTIGHSVKTFEDTIRICDEVLLNPLKKTE